MGRGLSDLQRQILGLVYERRQRRDFAEEERRQKESRERHRAFLRDMHGEESERLRALDSEQAERPYSMSDYPDTHNAYLIAALYDWPLRGSWWNGNRAGVRPSEGGKVDSHGQNFDRERVGEVEYNRKTAAYYRAVSRLKRRGLLAEHRFGLTITDEGMRVAEEANG